MLAAGMIPLNSTGSNHSSHDPQVLGDERLVAAAKMGHTAAFDELCRRHAEKIFHVAHRITRNREDAEDAVQESFLREFIHLKSFDGRSRFSTWLTRIAINSALMSLRKNRRSREIPMEKPIESSEPRRKQFARPDKTSPGERIELFQQKNLCLAIRKPDSGRNHFGVVQDDQLLKPDQID